jgi:Rod binding domain-containing protein
VLGEVEETIYTVDEEDEGGNGEVRTVKKQSEMLFVRGMILSCREACAQLFVKGRADFRCRRLRCPHFTSTITTPIPT